MESFVWTVAPIAIAFFGFVVMLVIMKLISGRDDSAGDGRKSPAQDPKDGQ